MGTHRFLLTYDVLSRITNSTQVGSGYMYGNEKDISYDDEGNIQGLTRGRMMYNNILSGNKSLSKF